MSLHRKVMFLAALVLVGAVAALPALRGQHQHRQPPKEQQSEDSPFPIVTFRGKQSAHEIDSKRAAKGKRYDNGGVVEKGSGLRQVVRSNNWEFEVADLPTMASDVVLVGTVSNAQAYLSPEGDGVYSEFTVTVDEVLKDTSASISADDSVVADREGGRVRYPSGEVVVYGVASQGMPRVTSQYVLFLKREDGNLRILTGYELQKGKARPLDYAKKFKRFEGMGKGALLNEIRHTLSADTHSASGTVR